jgi:hypothetical protein
MNGTWQRCSPSSASKFLDLHLDSHVCLPAATSDPFETKVCFSRFCESFKIQQEWAEMRNNWPAIIKNLGEDWEGIQKDFNFKELRKDFNGSFAIIQRNIDSRFEKISEIIRRNFNKKNDEETNGTSATLFKSPSLLMLVFFVSFSTYFLI